MFHNRPGRSLEVSTSCKRLPTSTHVEISSSVVYRPVQIPLGEIVRFTLLLLKCTDNKVFNPYIRILEKI
jgi:hypothetical protein